MIESFKHKGLKRLFEKGDRSRVRPDLVEKAERILSRLEMATQPDDLDLPGLKLHQLTGNLKGFWSVLLSRNHRIIFRFENDDAYDVDLIDYH